MYEIVKRIIDIFGSVFLAIVFSPVLLITAILIRLTSAGPILVEKTNRHMKRMGKGGKIFRLYKFRSMVVKADVLEKVKPEYREAYLEKHSGGSYKPKNDPRITAVGKFIRKHSIDEMPQLLNVFRGDMSIVGPRPYLPEELEEQQRKFSGTGKYVTQMLSVKPGITGFWQVSGRSEVNFDKRVKMDAFYAQKKSLIFDFLIMLKTPWMMLSGKGAV
ncbi:multidrug MFS transporter [Candidatus Woesebacteria bacterium CG07_land_8_20_14_0_80_44_9]|uniref:Multidrug MFS transporter n=3 Tax=Candidatus Woeseibacteriota TaxID=1752722 RepID=A0A2M6YEV7_9BACT|nr:MAG: multidrug MFS transporter [Candidatus Woesebacteria bacterium CG07_land_8_20_14_0_80_44_9]PIZ45910.1 MAG: multidrug MFS transporter [Candidatus Woesebacteria bacterium CG_4_10_14_0_2_um_filter_44_9]